MSIKVRPPGFSPFACFRRATGTTSSSQWILYHRKNTREYHTRSGHECLILSPVIILKRWSTGRYPEFSSKRYLSQVNAAVQVPSEISVPEETVPEIPPSLEKLTVKELRALLASRSMKISGLKKELIERLQSVSLETTPVTNIPPSEGHNQSPLEKSSPPRGKISGRFSKVSVKDLREMLAERGLPTTGLKAELVERLENAQPSSPSVIQSKESGTSSSVKPSEGEETFYEEWLGQIERQLALAKQDTALLVSQCSLLHIYLDLSEIATLSRLRLLNRLERELILCQHQNVLFRVELSLSQIPSILSSIRTRQRLQAKVEQLKRSNTQTIDFKSRLRALPKSLPTSKSPPTIPATLTPAQTKVHDPRLTARANLYISKIYKESLDADPRTTKGVILRELLESDIQVLHSLFLATVHNWANGGRELDEGYFNEAWFLALETLAGMGKSKRYCVKNNAVPTLRVRIEREPVKKSPPRLEEVPESKVESHVELSNNQLLELEDLVGMPGSENGCVKDDAVPTRRLQIEREPVKKSTARLEKVPEGRVESHVELSNNQLLEKVPEETVERPVRLTNNQWLALVKVKLSQNPITLRLHLNENLRHRYQRRWVSNNNSDEVFDAFRSMWRRLRLLDHILGIRVGVDDSEYLVTFKNFDAAAAFVNQVHAHWLDDEMTGQIYTTWDPIGTSRHKNQVTLTFPRATIEKWRDAAAKRGVPRSSYGHVLVDWESSLWAVFKRMGTNIGGRNCRQWGLVAEYEHVVIMEATFGSKKEMQRFLNRKREHYLSNPWKDRFFVKEKDRIFPEWMPEPTADCPVPATADLSPTALRRVWRGKLSGYF